MTLKHMLLLVLTCQTTLFVYRAESACRLAASRRVDKDAARRNTGFNIVGIGLPKT